VLKTLDGIPYEELDSPTLDLGPTRRLRCKREDVRRLADALAGRVHRPDSKIIERARPSEHPDHPGWFAREIRFVSTVTRDGAEEHVVEVSYNVPSLIPGF
jgi:hypothetical protein